MSQQKRLSYLLLINIAMITGLVTVGVLSHSLSLLAAGGDFIADSLAIALGLYAVHRRDVHGNSQATTFVALVNCFVLFLGTALVLWQAIHRLFAGSPEVHGLPVLVVSVISTVAMVFGAMILGRGAGNEDLHMRSVLLDTLADGLAAASVAVVGGIIYFSHGMYWLDSAAAIVIGLFIGGNALKLLFDVDHALHEHTPYVAKADDD